MKPDADRRHPSCGVGQDHACPRAGCCCRLARLYAGMRSTKAKTRDSDPTNYLLLTRQQRLVKVAAGEETQSMFTRLSDVQKVVIFAVLAVALALVMVPLVTDSFITKVAYMWTPGIAVLVMLLIVTRDGYSREGWKSLGLHRLGLSVWWIAFLGALLISVIATAIVWATPLASFVMPENVGGEAFEFVWEASSLAPS